MRAIILAAAFGLTACVTAVAPPAGGYACPQAGPEGWYGMGEIPYPGTACPSKYQSVGELIEALGLDQGPASGAGPHSAYKTKAR